MEKTKCKLCQQEIKGMCLTCSKGSLCSDCAKDISVAEYQPLASFKNILWNLAETFHRKGKGELISFEQVWKRNENLKLIDYEELIRASFVPLKEKEK